MSHGPLPRPHVTRRRRRSACLAAATLAAVAIVNAGASQGRPAAAAPGGRIVTNLSGGWRFRFGLADASVTSSGFADGDWQRVSVPHTWNRMGGYDTTRAAATDNRQGVGWYRLRIAAPPAAPSQRQYLDFAGVASIAKVWVNGTFVGEHRGGYTRFRLDVTAVWRPGESNLIAVEADNTKPAPGSSTAEVLPLQGDFFIFGGLYRAVTLVTTGPVGFDLLDHGGPGVYAHAAAITPDDATVAVLSRLRSAEAGERRLVATATIRDAAGRRVAQTSTPATLAAGATGEVAQVLHVARPHLWDGRADPYRYSVTVTLSSGSRIVDTVTQPLGLRTFHFDADRGFFLNGRHVALHGVARHQDLAGKGYALSNRDQANDMAMIAELGANTVRGAHYPHADSWYDEADRYGMVMWAEVPYIQASSFDSTDGTPATFVNAREQMTELIRQQYNHPSIMMWSTGNEVDASALVLRNGKPARGLALLQATTATARAEDPTRPTIFADCCEGTPYGRKDQQPLAGATDLQGYNRYYGWYYGKPTDYGPEFDKLHAKHPTTPLSVSEYGAGGAISQHTDNVLGGPLAAFGRPQPEEYESWFHENAYKAIAARTYIFASWVWNMFDFASDMRQEGDSFDLNTKGLVTYDRRTRKDAFYFYQANWSDKPMIHLNGKRYVERAYPVTDVRAYTTGTRASLRIDSRRIGEVDCPNHVCVWSGVALSPGVNAVTVSATSGERTVVDTARWTAPDARNGLFLRAGTLVGGVAADGRRFGSDNWFDGGNAVLLNAAFPGQPIAHPKVVTGTPDPWMYETYRSGASHYTLPLPDGHWTLVVHSFEPNAGAADTRSFAIKVNGRTMVDAFNPARAAGGVLVAVNRSIQVVVTGGRLTVEFVEQGGPPVVAAIEVRH